MRNHASTPRPRSSADLSTLLQRDPAAVRTGVAILRLTRDATLARRTPLPLTSAAYLAEAERTLAWLQRDTERQYDADLIPAIGRALELHEPARGAGHPVPDRPALQQAYKLIRQMARHDATTHQWLGRHLTVSDQIALALWQWPTHDETVASADVSGFPWLLQSYWKQFTTALLLEHRARRPNHPLWEMTRQWEREVARTSGLKLFMIPHPQEPPPIRTVLGPFSSPRDAGDASLQQWTRALLSRFILTSAETHAVTQLVRAVSEAPSLAAWDPHTRTRALGQWASSASHHPRVAAGKSRSHRQPSDHPPSADSIGLAWSHFYSALRPHIPEHSGMVSPPPLPTDVVRLVQHALDVEA